MTEEIESMRRQLEELSSKVAQIEERNMKVEGDKAWETSFARVLIIALLTYIGAVFVFMAIGVQNSFSNACIPSLAFVISTLSLPPIRKFWAQRYR